jgi:ferricrocin synthase
MSDEFASVACQVLLDHISQVPSTDIYQLSILNNPPTALPPTDGRQTAGNPQPSTLHSGFQDAAVLFPDRHALHFHPGPSPDEVFTYAVLERLTTSLAVRLRSMFSNEGTEQVVIPAYMPSCSAFHASWLAVLKAGFAFCPLPLDAPATQLQGILEEVGAAVVLLDGPEPSQAPWDAGHDDSNVSPKCLDVREFIEAVKANAPVSAEVDSLPEVNENDLAYVMYTSGSTGRRRLAH